MQSKKVLRAAAVFALSVTVATALKRRLAPGNSRDFARDGPAPEVPSAAPKTFAYHSRIAAAEFAPSGSAPTASK